MTAWVNKAAPADWAVSRNSGTKEVYLLHEATWRQFQEIVAEKDEYLNALEEQADDPDGSPFPAQCGGLPDAPSWWCHSPPPQRSGADAPGC